MNYQAAKKAILKEGAFIEPSFAISISGNGMANIRRTWSDLERLSQKSATRLIGELGMIKVKETNNAGDPRVIFRLPS